MSGIAATVANVGDLEYFQVRDPKPHSPLTQPPNTNPLIRTYQQPTSPAGQN